MTPEELFVELARRTPLSPERWAAILSLPPELQADELADYRDQDWAQPDRPAGAELLAFLGVVATVAADLTPVGTLITFLRGL